MIWGILGTLFTVTLGTVLIVARFAALAEKLDQARRTLVERIESSSQKILDLAQQLDLERHAREDRDRAISLVGEELLREKNARKAAEQFLEKLLLQSHPTDVASSIRLELDRLRKLSKAAPVPAPTSAKNR